MDRKHNQSIVHFAKDLRNGMTKEERHLWYDFLRDYPVKFIRQKVMGKYIADFYSPRAKLIIEIDGSQHYTEEGLQKDELRTEILEGYDLTVIRITNRQIENNFQSVCLYIDSFVKEAIKHS